MTFVLRQILNRAVKSWTVWASAVILILTSIPELVGSVAAIIGPVAPVLAAKITAAVLLLTRLRSIVVPVLKDLVGSPTTP